MKLIDVSSNNHPNSVPIDWVTVSKSYDAVYIKVGQGASYINPYWLSDARGAKAAGMKVGYYWYYDETAGPGWQAAMFAGRIPQGPPPDLIPMLDYEVGTPLDSVVQAFTQKVGRCGVYCDRNFFDSLDHSNGTWWLAYPGWKPNVESMALPSNVAVVQTGTITVPGITGDTDNDYVINEGAIMMTDATSGPTDFTNPPDTSDAPLQDASRGVANAPVVAALATQNGQGYWLVGADGGVFAFGSAKYFGSIPELIGAGKIKTLNRPICDIVSADDNGYALVAEDGGVFAFGSFPYKGAL